MAIRLTNGCINCENLSTESICKIHQVLVENIHTCDNFNMRVSAESEITCLTCTKYFTSKCPNKITAAPQMLCNEWAPKVHS